MNNQLQWVSEGRQHWLYVRGRVFGLVYKVHPHAFTVFKENEQGPYAREFLCEMPTLDEAMDVLQTVAGSHANF